MARCLAFPITAGVEWPTRLMHVNVLRPRPHGDKDKHMRFGQGNNMDGYTRITLHVKEVMNQIPYLLKLK